METGGPSHCFRGSSFLTFAFCPGNLADVPGEGEAIADFIWLWNLESWQTIAGWGCLEVPPLLLGAASPVWKRWGTPCRPTGGRLCELGP